MCNKAKSLAEKSNSGSISYYSGVFYFCTAVVARTKQHSEMMPYQVKTLHKQIGSPCQEISKLVLKASNCIFKLQSLNLLRCWQP